MNKTDNVYLEDILEALRQIEKFTKDVSYEQFEKEDMRHFAVIHMLEIIGEATNKLSQEYLKAHPDFPAKQMVGMRNFLVHGYDQIKLDIVWKTIKEDLLPLRIQLSDLSIK